MKDDCGFAVVVPTRDGGQGLTAATLSNPPPDRSSWVARGTSMGLAGLAIGIGFGALKTGDRKDLLLVQRVGLQ